MCAKGDRFINAHGSIVYKSKEPKATQIASGRGTHKWNCAILTEYKVAEKIP